MPEKKADVEPVRSYRKPRRNPGVIVYFIFSILAALFVGLFVSWAVSAMLDDHHPDFVIVLVLCPVLLTVIAVRYVRGARRAAVQDFKGNFNK